jgi:ABC-type branched-subunit amino acid transport system substrate-binding protein
MVCITQVQHFCCFHRLLPAQLCPESPENNGLRDMLARALGERRQGLLAAKAFGAGAHGVMAARGAGLVRHDARRLNVGIFIPTEGAAGIWGPSCRSCATLAAHEINEAGGILGLEVALRIEDAGADPDDTAERAAILVETGEIDAIVGMHISAVRESLVRTIGGVIPYVYTPLYEGGERTPGVYAIGETPADQLLPAMGWLGERYRVRRWVLLGNDYVWPHRSHALARQFLKAHDGEVVGERYLPFDREQFDDVLDWIAGLKPDAVLVSLVGQDAVNFNRAFGRRGLSERILRFSCAVEENVLLGIDSAHTDGLFAAAGYFANMGTRDNGGFKERYYGHLGDGAPMLNALGESLYEGMHFLRALLAPGDDWRRLDRTISFGGVRGAAFGPDRRVKAPIFLAEAKGNRFDIVTELGAR